MKVIHLVLGKANPDRMNGVNKVVHSLATQQYMLGADVEVWGITESPSIEPENRLYKTQLFQSIRNKWRIDYKLAKAIESSPSNTVFHLHAGFIPEFYSLAKKIKKENKKYILTPHGNYMAGAMRKNHFIKKLYFRFFEQRILKHAHFIHCIGFGEIGDIRKIYSEDNIKLIPNGQDFDSFNFQFIPIQHSEGPVFGFCGRVSMYQKGLDLLIQAFRIYKQSLNGKGELWLIGDGDYKDTIQKFAQEHG